MASLTAPLPPLGDETVRASPLSAPAKYALSVGMVAAAGLIALVVDHLVEAPNLALLFVLPVVVAAASFGWGPALASAVLGVAVLDFFYITPRYSFSVANPSDMWALALLLTVAAIVSTVAAQSRTRAEAARRAAEQAEALHGLAHDIVKGATGPSLIQAAANALARVFDAPALILTEQAGELTPLASAQGARLSPADLEAAQWALVNDQPTRGQTYPFDQAEFDFWPVHTAVERRLVLGVKFSDRPAAPERPVELIAGYLAGAPRINPS